MQLKLKVQVSGGVTRLVMELKVPFAVVGDKEVRDVVIHGTERCLSVHSFIMDPEGENNFQVEQIKHTRLDDVLAHYFLLLH